MKVGVFLLFVLTLASLSAGRVFMQEKPAEFRKVVEEKLTKYKSEKPVNGKSQTEIGIKLENVCPVNDSLAANRVFAEYGAIFVAQEDVKLPGRCIFESEESVAGFQQSADPVTEVFGRVSVTLQKPAMEALLRARDSAAKIGLTITPRGDRAASRSFGDTLDLWNSRFYPALDYWVGRGKISRQEAQAVKSRPLNERITKVLEWEKKGFYFSKDFRKTILQSVAVPGASQHIFMLALDVQQYGNSRVRRILAENGWFQTVKSDLPHFTYLGIKEPNVSKREEKLKKLGLKPVTVGGQEFWVPNL